LNVHIVTAETDQQLTLTSVLLDSYVVNG